jgi:cleavage and polyadenylation specificity factor subunit 4
MGLINQQQTAPPFGNSTTYLGNNGPMVSSNRPIGAPNHSIPMQSGMPVLGSTFVMPQLGQYPSGFYPQNLNPMSLAPMNLFQSPNQFFAHNSGNPPQYPSQSSVFMNGQFCLQNPMQPINQFVQMPLSNGTQVGPHSMHLPSNQVSHGLAPQNPAFFPNPQFGILHNNAVLQPNQDQHKLALSTMGANATAQGNSPLLQHTQRDFRASGSTKSQGNFGKDSGINNWNNNRKNSQNRKVTKDRRRDESHGGFSKPQSRNVQNAKGKFNFHNKHGGKGKLANSTNQTQARDQKKTQAVQRRPLPVYYYTEQEIKQWREERRKNYPSKCNVKKKLTESDVKVKDAMLRRQRLKEILAKQAQLGCEVAEIPPCYLSDSEKQGRRKEVGNQVLTNKGNSQTKYNKRGRFHQNGRFSKKQQVANHDSSNFTNPDEQFSKKQKLRDNDSRTKPSLNEKQPTLLQRLLSADIRKDKHHLLQAFRFMVMNSFFKDWPEKPLSFPLVTVKDNREIGYGDYPDDDGGADYEHEHDAMAKEAVLYLSSLKGGAPEELEEEGEIID